MPFFCYINIVVNCSLSSYLYKYGLVHLNPHQRSCFLQRMTINRHPQLQLRIRTAECPCPNGTSILHPCSQGLGIIKEERARRFYEPVVSEHNRAVVCMNSELLCQHVRLLLAIDSFWERQNLFSLKV